jgi:hypothetical protein
MNEELEAVADRTERDTMPESRAMQPTGAACASAPAEKEM